MRVERLVTNISQVVTASGAGAVRGAAMNDVHIIPDAAIAVDAGEIVWVGPRREWAGTAVEEIDAGWHAVVPGLIDPHTHLLWGGDRLNDFEARCRGVSYEAILAAGGGIRHTTAQTALASDDTLVASAVARARALIRHGATTIEVKSGYGDLLAAEERCLRLIRRLSAECAAHVVPTMLFHVPPRDGRERAERVQHAVTEWIPFIARESLATAIDVFVEREAAYSPDEADALFRAASAAGLRVKAHTDQLTVCGGTQLAIAHRALSVDHLETSGPDEIRALAASDTVGVLLPGVSLHLGMRSAPGRALIDAGAAVAVGSDCNPGSSPLFSPALAMALAVRINGLTPGEALTASTANSAAALGLSDTGRIARGMAADFLILGDADWRSLPYALGGDVVQRVFIAGHEVCFDVS